jgi:hypothetical protein
MFSIDFFELAFLAEACIPPTPIARALFWKSLIDVHYHQMTGDERLRLLEWLRRNYNYKHGLKNGNEDILLFEARYDPENQVVVETEFNDKREVNNAFKWKGGYYVGSNRLINKLYIVK